MITGSTRLAAVIGDPIRHSLSPVIHNAGFAALDLDWVYLAFPVVAGRGAAAVEAMRTFGIDGLSVTMPHKADVAAAADDLTPAARRLGVSNCLFRRGQEIVGDSTDGDGFLAAYEARFGETLAGRRVLVVGAGGAARAVVEAIGRSEPAGLTVINRSRSRAEALTVLAPHVVVGAADDPGPVGEADVIVNATSIGMAGGPSPDALPVPADALHDGQTVIDIVYDPRSTPLLTAAAERGARVGDGLGMLIHQAALAFERWTGEPAPVEAMRDAVDAALTPPL